MWAWIIAALISIVYVSGIDAMTTQTHTVIERADSTPEETEAREWEEYRTLAYADYSEEFTRLYNAYETRWSKNGRLMLRKGSSGPYKFVKRTA